MRRILDQAMVLLQRRGRVLSRPLQRQCPLDDEALQALKDALRFPPQKCAPIRGKASSGPVTLAPLTVSAYTELDAAVADVKAEARIKPTGRRYRQEGAGHKVFRVWFPVWGHAANILGLSWSTDMPQCVCRLQAVRAAEAVATRRRTSRGCASRGGTSGLSPVPIIVSLAGAPAERRSRQWRCP